MLPTRIDFKAGDRALAEGLAEGMRALEQIRRGRGKKLELGGVYQRLWDRLWEQHTTKRTRGLSERLWATVGRAA